MVVQQLVKAVLNHVITQLQEAESNHAEPLSQETKNNLVILQMLVELNHEQFVVQQYHGVMAA